MLCVKHVGTWTAVSTDRTGSSVKSPAEPSFIQLPQILPPSSAPKSCSRKRPEQYDNSPRRIPKCKLVQCCRLARSVRKRFVLTSQSE